MAHITIKDRPCGWGKSTELAASFRTAEKYIVVLPVLSEVDRIIKRAKSHSKFNLQQPASTATRNKHDHATALVKSGESVACTHALLYRLGTLATECSDDTELQTVMGFEVHLPSMQSLLYDYNLIIDEVVNPFEVEQGTQPNDFTRDYVGLGMATVDPDTGQAKPTVLWDESYRAGGKTFKRDLYERAKSGALYVIDGKLFIMTIPMELLRSCREVGGNLKAA